MTLKTNKISYKSSKTQLSFTCQIDEGMACITLGAMCPFFLDCIQKGCLSPNHDGRASFVQRLKAEVLGMRYCLFAVSSNGFFKIWVRVTGT